LLSQKKGKEKCAELERIVSATAWDANSRFGSPARTHDDVIASGELDLKKITVGPALARRCYQGRRPRKPWFAAWRALTTRPRSITF